LTSTQTTARAKRRCVAADCSREIKEPWLNRRRLRVFFWALWVCGVATFGVALALASVNDGDLWRVAIPGIATAAGTAGLAIATGYLALGERVDARADKLEADRTDAAQRAREVFMVYTTPANPLASFDTLLVVNASRSPVFDLDIEGAQVAGQPGAYRHQVDKGPDLIAVVMPGEQRTVHGLFHGSPVAHWSDSSSRRWTRVGRRLPET
jgi:hypothetical protein